MSSTSGFVDSNLSPAKIELAPAKTHRLSFARHVGPSSRKSYLRIGHSILVVATITNHFPNFNRFSSSIGVPSTATSAFIGTDSGC
jgi:hypothetical protein